MATILYRNLRKSEVLYKKGFSSQFQKYHPDKETNEAKDFNENGSYKKRCIVDGAQNRSSPFSLRRQGPRGDGRNHRVSEYNAIVNLYEKKTAKVDYQNLKNRALLYFLAACKYNGHNFLQ